MKKEEILVAMKNYIHKYTSYKSIEDIEQIKVADILVSSFDVVDFTMQLEEGLGLGEDYLDLKVWAPKFIDITFGELALELEQLVAELNNPNSEPI